MTIVRYLAAACLVVPALFAHAAGPDGMPRADHRQANQAARIQQGAASGALTPRETAKLQRGQAHVQNMENRAKADGVVTNRERARLQHAQDVQSRKIYREKHDRQTDFNHDGRNDRRHFRRTHRGHGHYR